MDKPEHLLEKYRQNTCTEAELQALYKWLEAEAANGTPYVFEGDADRKALKNAIKASIDKGIKVQQPVRKMNMHWLRYAAVLVFLAALTVLYFNLPANHKPEALVSGIRETRQYTLPDGSKVWLNANSRIRYANDFAGNRSVYLEQGEAFFEVQHDTAHPFRVYCDKVYTQVLGTSFSVKRLLASDDVKVSVVTGKVKVFNDGKALAVLTPGMGLHVEAGRDTVSGTQVTSQEARGWIEGDIVLAGASLEDIIQLLKNNYNLPVKDETGHRSSNNIYLHVNKDIPLSELLDILNLVGAEHHLQFTHTNNAIHISDKLN